MINVSQLFKNAVTATSRSMGGKVIFQIVDTTAQSEAVAAVTSESIISKKDQVFNGQTEMSGKYATMEPNYWKLDGTFILPPKQVESGSEIGWWSDLLSGVDGSFSTPQLITVQLTTNHSSIGLVVFFDSLTGEYADTFTIDVYNSSNSIIYTITVTGNTLSQYTLRQNLSNYRKIIVTVNKWCNPYRRARITEISFGIVEVYTGNELISTSVLEEVDTLSNTVTANELRFTLSNLDKRFNLINPSGIYPYLQRRQKLNVYMGVIDPLIEYVPMGVYYLSEWKSDEGTLTASFTARDILDILAQSTYRKGKYQNRSLGNLAVDVLTDAGITDYYIDPSLFSISVTGHIGVMTHREALQLIAFTGMAVVYSDRYGKVIIKQLSGTATGETIDYANTYAAPQIKLGKLINTVDIVVNAYTPDSAPSELLKSTITLSGTTDVWIEYDLAQSVSVALSAGTLNTATYYGSAALLNITYTGIVTITATGTLLNNSAAIYELKDGTAPAGEQSLPIKVDNSLITSSSIAANVAAWVLAEFQKRFLYEINWRQNPMLEAGDIVIVQDDFSANKPVMITKQEFNFSGALSGKTGGRG